MAEKDVYIQKGEILRGKKARKEMLKKDIEELKKRYPVIDVPKLKDSDLRQNISPISDGRTIGDNVDLDDKNSGYINLNQYLLYWASPMHYTATRKDGR